MNMELNLSNFRYRYVRALRDVPVPIPEWDFECLVRPGVILLMREGMFQVFIKSILPNMQSKNEKKNVIKNGSFSFSFFFLHFLKIINTNLSDRIKLHIQKYTSVFKEKLGNLFSYL